MNSKDYAQLKRMFIIGIVSAAMTMLGGEMPIGWTVYPEADNELMAMIMGCGNLTTLQLACGVLFGGIGIPLQYYGYKAIACVMEMGGNRKCRKLVHLGAKAIAFWGGAVHIICVALMFLCRIEETHTLQQLPKSVMDFTLWLVLPISAVFMIIYIPMTIAMMLPVVRGTTIFPRWAVVFNPIFFKILLNVISIIAPNTALMNGIRMSNMGFGSLVTFIGLLILLVKYEKKQNHTLGK